MNVEKVKRLQDDDGHWYWIPAEMAKQFETDLEALPEMVPGADESVYQLYGDFEVKYDEYRTGGSPDCMPACFTEADQVIEVLVDRLQD